MNIFIYNISFNIPSPINNPNIKLNIKSNELNFLRYTSPFLISFRNTKIMNFINLPKHIADVPPAKYKNNLLIIQFNYNC